METALSEQFKVLLERGAQELFEDNQHRMTCADLFTTRNTIADDDLRRFFLGVQHGAVTLVRGARFNTLDRPKAGGRRLPQIAAYVEAIQELGYPSQRVFFELPHVALKLDLAIVDDDGAITVLGEAKRAVLMLDAILKEIQDWYSTVDPGEEGGNEARQLAWRLWRTRAPYLWFIGPAERRAYRVRYAPLALEPLPALPSAKDVGLAHVPTRRVEVPTL
jgi:hypothetical protein